MEHTTTQSFYKKILLKTKHVHFDDNDINIHITAHVGQILKHAFCPMIDCLGVVER